MKMLNTGFSSSSCFYQHTGNSNKELAVKGDHKAGHVNVMPDYLTRKYEYGKYMSFCVHNKRIIS